MAVLPLTSIFEELQLTVTSAESSFTSLKNDVEIMLSCEISSLPTHNCNMVFRKSDSNDAYDWTNVFSLSSTFGYGRNILNYKNFEKLEKICSGGEPVRPISLYLKIAKREKLRTERL